MSRREDAATATVGLSGVAGSAVAREHVLRSAYRQTGMKRKKPPGVVMLRGVSRLSGKRGLRAAYAGTLAAGTLASVPAVAGTTGLFRRSTVAKTTNEERIKAFIGTGVKGSAASLKQKATNVREPVPTRYRAGQGAAGLGAGALGAQLTHAALNRAGRLRGGRTRAAATALGATVAGAASLPATSAGIRRASHGAYRATPTGVVRAKKVRRPASSKATLVQRGRPVPRGFEKRDPKTGYEGVGYRGRVARVYAAGALPGPAGPINAARQAGRMVPASQQRSASATQYGLAQGGRYAGMVAGAYGAAALASRSKHAERGAVKIKGGMDRGKAAVTSRVPGYRHAQRAGTAVRGRLVPRPRPGGPGKAGRLVARAAAPLARQKAAAGLGALVGGSVVGGAGTLAATRISYDRERRARAGGTARHGSKRVAKADTLPGLNRRDTLRQIKRKQHNIAVGSMAAGTGLGALGLLGASALPKVPKKVRGRLVRASGVVGTTSAGLGGVAGLDANRIARRDISGLKRQLDVRKADDPIKTYGDRGPLPKGLPREEKMRAYAARVEHHGGKKAKKWQRRASAADATRNVLVAGATGAGAILLTGRSRHVANVARRTPVLRRAVGHAGAAKHAETAALATGTAIGGTELAGEYARRRRSRYSSSPGGAAQSALTRMQANTPGGAR